MPPYMTVSMRQHLLEITMIQWTPHHLGMVIDRYKHGQSCREIAADLKRSKSSISYIINRYKNHNTYDPLPHPGRPKKLSVKKRRLIVRHIRFSMRFDSLENIIAKLDLDISPSTLRRILREARIKSYTARRSTALTPAVKLKRLMAAKQHRKVDWSTVLFSDESNIDIHLVGGRKKKVLRTKEEKDSPACIMLQNAASKQTMMVWAAVGIGYKSPLIRIPLNPARGGVNNRQKAETVNGPKYASMIERFLGPFYWLFQLKRTDGKRVQSLEDNAPAHNSLPPNLMRQQWAIQRINHPPRSPDLNAIECCWHMMKARMQCMKGHVTNKDNLFNRAEEAWDSIPQHLIDKQIMKMKRRYQMVWKRGGGAITDWHDMD
jgi:transposase